MSCTDIQVSPDVFQMGSQETLPLTFDAAGVLADGESIQTATASLVQVDTGLDYVAGRTGGVTVAGTDLTQVVTALQARKRYRLVIRFEISSQKVWAPYLLIDCPE